MLICEGCLYQAAYGPHALVDARRIQQTLAAQPVGEQVSRFTDTAVVDWEKRNRN